MWELKDTLKLGSLKNSARQNSKSLTWTLEKISQYKGGVMGNKRKALGFVMLIIQ